MRRAPSAAAIWVTRRLAVRCWLLFANCWPAKPRRPSGSAVNCVPHETYFGGGAHGDYPLKDAGGGRRFQAGLCVCEKITWSSRSKQLFEAMTLLPGDRVRLKPEHAAVRS